MTDSKIPSENFKATYTNGVLTKVEKTAGGRPVVIDRALNGSVITETTKLDDSVIATRTITYLSPEEIQVQIEEVVTTVKLDPGNGWSVKETSSPFGTGSFSAVAEDFSFDSLFKPGGLDAGKIETSVTTNPGGGLKESEVKRDDAKIASAEGANHDPASDRPTKVTFEDGTTRQNNIKQGVSTGGTDEAGRKSSVDISGTGKINSLVIDDIDLTPDVDPATGTTTIGNNLASIKTDFFGTPLEMGGDAGTPWSLVSPYNGDFSLSVDGRTLDGNFGTWGDPHSGEGLGGKGGRTHWRAGGHPETGTPCLVREVFSGTGANEKLIARQFIDGLGRVVALETPHPGGDNEMVSEIYTYDFTTRTIIIKPPAPSPTLTIQYTPDWQSGTVTGGGQNWEFTSDGTGKTLNEALKLAGNIVSNSTADLLTGETTVRPLGNEQNKVVTTVDPKGQKTKVKVKIDGPVKAEVTQNAMKGKVSSVNGSVGGVDMNSVIERGPLHQVTKVNTYSAYGRSEIEIEEDGNLKKAKGPGYNIGVNHINDNGDYKVDINNAVTGRSASQTIGANGDPKSLSGDGMINRTYQFDDATNTLTFNAPTGQVLFKFGPTGLIIQKQYPNNCIFNIERNPNGSAKSITAGGAETISFGHDNTGRMSSANGPGGTSWAITQRQAGTAFPTEIESFQGSLADRSTIDYDGLLVEQRIHTDGELEGWSVKWEYDANHRPFKRILLFNNVPVHSANFRFDAHGKNKWSR